jgi:hypothetical protein
MLGLDSAAVLCRVRDKVLSSCCAMVGDLLCMFDIQSLFLSLFGSSQWLLYCRLEEENVIDDDGGRTFAFKWRSQADLQNNF